MRSYQLITITVILIVSQFSAQRINPQEIKYEVKKYHHLSQEDILVFIPDIERKILSGKLVLNLSEKAYLLEKGLLQENEAKETVVIYTEGYPTYKEIDSLELLGINCVLDVWTPPLQNHPLGFFIAEVPVAEFSNMLSLDFIKKVDTAEYQNSPQNNYGIAAVNADDVWTLSSGYDGTGVKVGVLDSGIDTYYDGTEFPSSFQRMDYSNYPTTDPIVENTVTGHGTHVAGSVLGRGVNSIGRIDEGNGSSPFKGAAPGADLLFLKIGIDGNGGATSSAMIGAMNDAVLMYNADVLTMSYGGWYTYHDGSSATEQKVDWVYSLGVPFFISAGNDANDDKHYSGTVSANSSTGFIAINAQNGSALTFNLVWYDGLGTNNNLYMEYYDQSQNLLTKVEYTTTESPRGTESKYSNHDSTVTSGTYYVKVFNTSSNSQVFHIYFDDFGFPDITFQNADPFYTIGQPASADYGFAVGSYVSRDIWVASDGLSYWYGPSFVVNGIAPYSSRGPRIDGVQKPNITAPGSAIISVRDTDVLTTVNTYWIDNNGTLGSGGANYFVMTGTSMACPIAAGCAALLLDFNPNATPQLIYDAIQNSANTSGTGTVPNNTWGYGKFDVLAATNEPLPVELVSFEAEIKNNLPFLNWQTETEINNYGFEIERASLLASPRQEWEKIGFVEGSGNSNSPKFYSFKDDKPAYGNISYRLKQIDTDGTFSFSDIVEIEFHPTEFSLNQNYPNPFNPETTIEFLLPLESNVKLNIYNSLGELVGIAANDNFSSGKHLITWNGSDYSSGVYYFEFIAKQNSSGRVFRDTKKMILMK